MTVEAVAALASFAGLFVAWVILPSRLQKKHDTRFDDKTPEQPV